jgi:hypothetical protein
MVLFREAIARIGRNSGLLELDGSDAECRAEQLELEEV